MSRPRIGIFAHSTLPRGGVVHAMHLAEALSDAGADATLLAPALPGAAFARRPRCASVLIPAVAVSGVAALVARRIDEIADFLDRPAAPRFDIVHAQDPITANALIELRRRGRIPGFVRTVHHLDNFTDRRLAFWQDAAMREAAALCCVSRLWQARIASLTGRTPTLVGNGVDSARFSPGPDARDAALRARLGLSGGPLYLSVGGIERRKNTLNILRAFLRLRAAQPDAHLLVAGGASLLDHGEYRAVFQSELAAAGATAALTLAGVIDESDMPALYRLADALVFVSREEGFGLCAIEAMACGTPVIVADAAPFREHLRAEDCLWAAPDDVAGIACAMRAATLPAVAARLARAGPRAAAGFTWAAVAARHQAAYAVLEACHYA